MKITRPAIVGRVFAVLELGAGDEAEGSFQL